MNCKALSMATIRHRAIIRKRRRKRLKANRKAV